jgi:hypothetical protein
MPLLTFFTRLRHACLLLPVALLCACADDPAAPPAADSPQRTRLLTGEQYTNSIARVFGRDIADSVFAPMPPMARTDGLGHRGEGG